MTRHKHAELITAWANGAIIQYWRNPYGWDDCSGNSPAWDEDTAYRIKPEPKPNVVRYVWATEKMGEGDICFTEANGPNLKLVFDSETRKLKDAKLI